MKTAAATRALLLAAALALASASPRRLMSHHADWFRENAGKHNGLDLTDGADIADMVSATTCLPDDFVKVNKDGEFVINDEPFIFAGWNQWEILEAASDAPPPFRHLPLPGREHIVRLFNEAVDNGLKVVRIWAHTITKGHAMQTKPGEFNEKIFEGMDFVMDQAHRRGLRIIWALVDNWYPVGGVDNYVEWSSTAEKHQDFFTDALAQRYYRGTIDALTGRVNSINGRLYRDDPTIMAWNLANEARCKNCKSEVMHKWIERTCKYLKTQDPNHLVGIGYEGFYGPDSGRTADNPGLGGSDWASREGQDFVANNQIPCVDYVGIHVWPDDWNFVGTDFQKKFIKAHIDDARKDIPGKPFVLEEFGKIVEDKEKHVERNKYFRAAYQIAEAAAEAGDLQGTLFWHWYDRGVGPGRYGVHSDDTTFPIILKHVAFMNKLSGVADHCPAPPAAPAPTASTLDAEVEDEDADETIEVTIQQLAD